MLLENSSSSAPCVLHVHHWGDVQGLGHMTSCWVEQKGHPFSPGRVGHLSDTHLKDPAGAVAVVHADGVLVVARTDGVGQ